MFVKRLRISFVSFSFVFRSSVSMICSEDFQTFYVSFLRFRPFSHTYSQSSKLRPSQTTKHTGILLCVVDCSKINSNWKAAEFRTDEQWKGDDDNRRERSNLRIENHGKKRKMFVKMWNIPAEWIRHTSNHRVACLILLFPYDVCWCHEWVRSGMPYASLSASTRNVGLTLTRFFSLSRFLASLYDASSVDHVQIRWFVCLKCVNNMWTRTFVFRRLLFVSHDIMLEFNLIWFNFQLE